MFSSDLISSFFNWIEVNEDFIFFKAKENFISSSLSIFLVWVEFYDSDSRFKSKANRKTSQISIFFFIHPQSDVLRVAFIFMCWVFFFIFSFFFGKVRELSEHFWNTKKKKVREREKEETYFSWGNGIILCTCYVFVLVLFDSRLLTMLS